MTYLTPPRRVRRTPKRTGLGWSLDEWVNEQFNAGGNEELACLNQANNSAAVKTLEARISSLNANWNPTGFYTPDEMSKVVSETLKIATSANSILRAAPLSTGDALNVMNQAIGDVQKKTMQSLNYSAAVGEAQTKGIKAINAPGLKEWVLSTMRAAAQSIVTAGVLQCNMTWLASAIITFQKVFDAVAAVVVRIAGVAIKLGEVALNVIEEVPDLASKLLFVAKWGVIAFAAAFAIKKIKDARR